MPSDAKDVVEVFDCGNALDADDAHVVAVAVFEILAGGLAGQLAGFDGPPGELALERTPPARLSDDLGLFHCLAVGGEHAVGAGVDGHGD